MPRPLDATPMRSPQDVHTAIAKRLIGRSVMVCEQRAAMDAVARSDLSWLSTYLLPLVQMVVHSPRAPVCCHRRSARGTATAWRASRAWRARQQRTRSRPSTARTCSGSLGACTKSTAGTLQFTVRASCGQQPSLVLYDPKERSLRTPIGRLDELVPSPRPQPVPVHAPALTQIRTTLAPSALGYLSVGTDYRRHAGLDSDFITWWAEEPILKNKNVLRALKAQLKEGRLRPTAEAIMIFDPKWPPDLRDYKAIMAGGVYADKPAWAEDVQVEETALCRNSTDGRLRKRPYLCARAQGVFHLAGVRIASVRD